MDDIEQDGNATENADSQGNSEAMDTSTVPSSQSIYEREDRIIIDYGELSEKYKDLFDADEVRREGDRLQRHVNELANTIQRIQAPNMRVRSFIGLPYA